MKIYLKLFGLLALFSFPAQAADSLPTTIVGEVTHVRDGDTIEVNLVTGIAVAVRLQGLSAPEMDQISGVLAHDFMVDLVLNEIVVCELNGSKSYDRQVGICKLGGRDIAGELIKRGLFVVSGRDENLHKVLNGSSDSPGLLHCQVCLRNGLEIKWPVSGRTSDLTSIVDALEGL